MHKMILNIAIATALCTRAAYLPSSASTLEVNSMYRTEIETQVVESVESPIETMNGIEHIIVLDMPKMEGIQTLSDFEIPANTMVYVVQSDIITSIEISVDCVDNLYYGISAQSDGTGCHWNSQVMDGSSRAIFVPEANSYYLYLANNTDSPVSVSMVSLTAENIQMKSRSQIERVHPILNAAYESK